MVDKFITITDQLSINEDEIISSLNKGSYVTIQYSKPIFNVELLERINRLCKIANENLTLRFFYGRTTVVDCECLKYLPNVKSLNLNCVFNVKNFDNLKSLKDIVDLTKQPLPPHLETLGFGTFNVKKDDEIAKRLIEMGYRC